MSGNVVDAGGSASARPLGLPLPEDVHWFDVDLPGSMCGKCERVEAAGGREGQRCVWTAVASHFLKADFVRTLEDHG